MEQVIVMLVGSSPVAVAIFYVAGVLRKEMVDMKDDLKNELHLLNTKMAEIIVQISFHDKRLNNLERKEFFKEDAK